MIQCTRCHERYLGESERKLSKRISEHLTYIRTCDMTQPTGHHFNLPGHSLADLKVLVIEKVKKNDTLYRKEREHCYAFQNGINRKP